VSTLPRTQLHQLAILQVIKVFDDAMMITSQPLAAPLVCSFETTRMLQHVQERSGHLGNRAGYRYPGACIFPNETLAVMIGHRCGVPPDTWLPLGVIPVHPHLPFQVCGCPPKWPNKQRPSLHEMPNKAQLAALLLGRVTKPVAVVRGGNSTVV
jgi:hypothetical protein